MTEGKTLMDIQLAFFFLQPVNAAPGRWRSSE